MLHVPLHIAPKLKLFILLRDGHSQILVCQKQLLSFSHTVGLKQRGNIHT